MYSLPTFQKLVQSTNPVVSVLLVGRFEPHQCALDIRLWGHWPETESRVRSDQTVIELPLRFVLIQCLPKHSQHCGEETSECSIEESVEKKNFRCKEKSQWRLLRPINSCSLKQLVRYLYYRALIALIHYRWRIYQCLSSNCLNLKKGRVRKVFQKKIAIMQWNFFRWPWNFSKSSSEHLSSSIMSC